MTNLCNHHSERKLLYVIEGLRLGGFPFFCASQEKCSHYEGMRREDCGGRAFSAKSRVYFFAHYNLRLDGNKLIGRDFFVGFSLLPETSHGDYRLGRFERNYPNWIQFRS